MVEVDVREHEVPQLPDPEPVCREALPQRLQAARRPAVHERSLVPRQQVGADDALVPEVPEPVLRLSAEP